jgi:hypothetical protein
MQQPQNQNANLLSIFSFVFAGIQGLALLFIGLYAVVMAFVMISSMVTNSRNTDAGAYLVTGLITAFFVLMGAFGLTNVLLNIKLGRMLRSKRLPTQKRVIVTSIFNLCSFLCGGVFILPFGMALGIFGIVFASSDNGKAFLSGKPMGTLLPPPPPINYGEVPRENHTWQ